MSEPVTYPAPVLSLPIPPRDKWERDRDAFLRLLPSLLQTHRGVYAAINNEQVVDFGEDKIALALRVYAKFGYMPVYVGLVTERPLPPERAPIFHLR